MFGGKTLQSGDTMGTGKNLFLGDMWELSRGRVRDEVLTYTGGSIPYGPGLPYALQEGNEEYFAVNASFASNLLGSSSKSEGELCVEDISVEVSITQGAPRVSPSVCSGQGRTRATKTSAPRTGARGWACLGCTRQGLAVRRAST